MKLPLIFLLLICGKQYGREGFPQSSEVSRSALNPASATCQLCDLDQLLSLSEPDVLTDGACWKCPAVQEWAGSPGVRLNSFRKRDRTTSRTCPLLCLSETCWWGEQMMVEGTTQEAEGVTSLRS